MAAHTCDLQSFRSVDSKTTKDRTSFQPKLRTISANNRNLKTQLTAYPQKRLTLCKTC